MSRLHVAALMEAHTVTGPAKNLLRFARLAAASPEGVRVSIVTFVRGAVLRPNAFIEAVRAQDIPIYPIHERFRFDPGIVSGLRQTLSELRPDIVQTHGVKSHFLVRRLRPRPTWVAFHHGYTAEDLKMHVYNQLNRWTLPDADCVITVCKPFCDLLAAQ